MDLLGTDAVCVSSTSERSLLEVSAAGASPLSELRLPAGTIPLASGVSHASNACEEAKSAATETRFSILRSCAAAWRPWPTRRVPYGVLVGAPRRPSL